MVLERAGRDELKKLLDVVIKLLKNYKEQLDTTKEISRCMKFSFQRFEGSDQDIQFWTGFYSYQSLLIFYQHLLEPHVYVLHYWGSKNSETKAEYTGKCGPKRQLDPVDEMFMTLVKLKQGSACKDIAERFNISESQVTRIFVTWVNFMHGVLNDVNIWMSKRSVRKFMPECFKGLYSDVRVIIDCTEIPLEKPSDFESQAATYSMYKHCNTVKGLVGISPSGVPTFVSKTFEGSISDNEITIQSGLLDKLDINDAVMADRGFTLKELFAKHKARLIIPHFLSGKAQMGIPELVESVAIARVRIHVERCMGRIKQWRIMQRKLPITYWNQINEIFQLCAYLSLFWPPLLDNE
jgi:hypothetical protein